jgi:hypothetical protein
MGDHNDLGILAVTILVHGIEVGANETEGFDPIYRRVVIPVVVGPFAPHAVPDRSMTGRSGPAIAGAVSKPARRIPGTIAATRSIRSTPSGEHVCDDAFVPAD